MAISGITFKKNFDLKRIADERAERTKRELGAALFDAKAEIVDRTLQGRDVDSRGFKNYSERYGKAKLEKTGRATPNLTVTGNMLKNITVKVEQVGKDIVGRLFFSSTAEATKARYNQAIRKFFGLDTSQFNRLIERIRGAWNK